MSSPNKKAKTTKVEKLEQEARRFVEGAEVGPVKRTLTDYLWDKDEKSGKKSGPGPRDKGKPEDKDKEMEDVEKDEEAAAAKKKKSKKRKAETPPADDKESDDEKEDASAPNPFYSRYAGQTEISGAFKDRYGNAAGNRYDLIQDFSMKGFTIVVFQFCNAGLCKDYDLALKTKGFTIIRHTKMPGTAAFEKELQKANQCWIISSGTEHFKKGHLKLLKDFYEAGRGVFIWGDNEPLYADANLITKALFGKECEMRGNEYASKNVQETSKPDSPGYLRHFITTGIETLYEGVTIATITPGKHLKPLMWGSASNLVTAYCDEGIKRAIVDGGFTRLFCSWDAAGTARFVKNCAGFLANIENLGNKKAVE